MPSPSGEGHVISAGATVGFRAGGGAGFPLAGFAVGFVCASTSNGIAPARMLTTENTEHTERNLFFLCDLCELCGEYLVIDAGRHVLRRRTDRSAKLDELEKLHACAGVVAERPE